MRAASSPCFGRLLRRVLVLALLASAPLGIVFGAPAADRLALKAAAPKSEVFYQIFLRSFYDSSGDRIGDLRGVQDKLDYLNALGVTSILLTPLQPSPFYHNYFASNFEGIDPAYGTMADFQALVRAVHARGMRIYLDEEIQYVTQDNPWLKSSLGRPGSKYSHYVLYDGPGNTKPEPACFGLSVLPGYDGRRIGVATVNLRDPEVLAYFEKLFAFWIDPHGDRSLRDGVDGFRIDHMMDDLDNKGKLTDLFAKFWRPIFAQVRALNPHARIIAEQADWGYGRDWLTRGGADLVFAFPLRQAIVSFHKAAIVRAIRETLAATPPGKSQLTIIENHDTNRFASEVGGSLAKEKIGAAFDLLLQGTPLIYYGQELGMRGKQFHSWGSDANDIPDREAFRWSRNLEAPGSAIWYRGPHPWWTDRYNRSGDGISVEEESRNPDSLLEFYRTLLRIRAQRPELQRGGETILSGTGTNVICFMRELGRDRTLVAINLSGKPVRVVFPPAEVAALHLAGEWKDLLREPWPTSVTALTLAPYEVRVAGTP